MNLSAPSFFAAALLVLATSHVALAQSKQCVDLLRIGHTEKVTQDSASIYRADLIRKLAKAKIPAVVRVNSDGSLIPVILMSKETHANQELQALISDTMGMGIDISQGKAGGNDVDHGLARTGKYYVDIIRQGDGMNIDPVTGKTRYGSNELNYTALRSRNWDGYMERRNAESRVQIELAYLSSREDRETSIAYHNLRRAGIINVVIESVLRFEKNWNIEWLDEPIRNAPRLMADGCSTVNCFTNYMGSRIPAQIDVIKHRISSIASMNHVDSEMLLQNHDIAAVLSEIQTALTRADWKDPQVLHPHFVNNELYLNRVRQVPEFANLTREQLTDVMSYLAAIHISREFLDVIRDQGAHVYAGHDSNAYDHWPNQFSNRRLEMDSANPRAVAVFVYSDAPGAAEALLNGTFEYLGAIWGIWRNGASPDGNHTISIEEALMRIH